MPAESQRLLNYGISRKPMPTRRQFVIAALVFLALASVLGLPFLGNLYAANRFPGVTPGMTRAQVELLDANRARIDTDNGSIQSDAASLDTNVLRMSIDGAPLARHTPSRESHVGWGSSPP